MHNPYSTDTDRRVWAMVGRVCEGCRLNCGDLDRCPMLLARWRGDWSGEFAVNEVSEESEVERVPSAAAAPQMSLF